MFALISPRSARSHALLERCGPLHHLTFDMSADSAPSSSHASASELRDVLVDLCRVGKRLDDREERTLHQLVEVLKARLREKCLELIEEAEGYPVLFASDPSNSP